MGRALVHRLNDWKKMNRLACGSLRPLDAALKE
jgi:hypothetical protein